MSSSNCCFLACIWVSQETGKVVWYSHLFKNFSQFLVIHTLKGLGVVNEAEVDVCLEFLCFFYDTTDVGNLISGFSAFSKSSLYIWKFSVYALLKPSLKDLEHYLATMQNVYYKYLGMCPLSHWTENSYLLEGRKLASFSLSLHSSGIYMWNKMFKLVNELKTFCIILYQPWPHRWVLLVDSSKEQLILFWA